MTRILSLSMLHAIACLTLLTSACTGTRTDTPLTDTDAGTDAFVETDAELDSGEEIDLGHDAGEPIDDPRQLPRDIRRAAPDLMVAMENHSVRVFIREASTLTDEEIGAYLAASTSALEFNMREMEFTAEQIAAEPRVRIVVLDVPTYNEATEAPDTYGISYPAFGSDGDAFVIPDTSFSNPTEMDDTLAHEINHILVGRRTPNDYQIPWWQVEGTAIDMGSHYGWELHHIWTGFIKDWVDVADGEDVETTFERYDVEDNTQTLAEVGQDQSLSGFFIEYLRYLHPHADAMGYPDVHARMLAVSSQTSDGADFAEAFAMNFDGLALADAKSAYVDFMSRTAHALSMRYAGTIFASH